MNKRVFSTESAKSPPRVRLKSFKLICTFNVLWMLCIHGVYANRPPRFLIDGRSEIVIRLKEGPDTPVGELLDILAVCNYILPS